MEVELCCPATLSQFGPSDPECSVHFVIRDL